MSGARENRWQRQGQANRQNQDRNSGTSTPTKDGRQQAMSSLTGNAWGPKGKVPGPAPTAAAQAQAQSEPHVPVRDFNAHEVREFLKKKYLESTADQPSAYHKVQGDSVPKRSSGAWGARSNTMTHLMPSGQDFFTQLKKQLVNLEQGKPVQ
ncbi:hypothetical protein ACN47E_006280 [Coniothyrium glycines]